MAIRATAVAVVFACTSVLLPAPAAAEHGDHDVDCADFPDHWTAQAFYEAHGGPAVDPYSLDADWDGVACEWNAW